jgi:hypothetical protein
MKKTTILLLTALFISTTILAQRGPDHPKHENHYKIAPAESEDLTIEFVDAESQKEFAKVKLVITNKTNDYILYKSSETIFKFEHGEYHAKANVFTGEDMLIEPKSTQTKVIKVTGDHKFHVAKFNLVLNGFYKISANGKIIEAADFQLPAATNDFIAGPFKCSLEKSKQQTSETSAQFSCTYTGTQIGLLDPSKLSVKTKDGTLYANDKKKDKTIIMLPGNSHKFTAEFHIPGKIVDMQLAVLHIVWKDTFTESKMTPLKMGTALFVLDPEVTLLKNK